MPERSGAQRPSGWAAFGATGVTSLLAGVGIGVSAATGDVTVSNTGVTSLAAGAGISVDVATGAITIGNSGVLSITGTPNQVIASSASGAVTLSLPQDLATTSIVRFGGLLSLAMRC